MLVKISILIPCFNAEQWVGEAIESALGQTYPYKEVIVVDDGSSDGSLDVIRSFGDRIRWETGPNRGGNVARNRLLELAQGEWVQYLDADDYLLPDKIERQVTSVDEEADVVYGPSIMQYHEDGVVRRTELPIPEPHDPWRLLALWKLPQTGSPLWRKQAILDVGGWDEKRRVCQEHDLYLRLLEAGKRFKYVNATGAVYRQWSEQTVCRVDKPRTYGGRIEIMRRAEDFLERTGQMTPLRREAFNAAYLECSRIIWTFDRQWAREIMEHVEKSNHGTYRPDRGQVPALYVWLYRFFGFEAAEQVAALKRLVFK